MVDKNKNGYQMTVFIINLVTAILNLIVVLIELFS